MQETRLGSRFTGLWFVALAFLLAFTVGCASWFSDDEPGGGAGQTWALTGVAAAPTTVDVGVDSTLTATVTNPDGVALTYTWAGGGGTIVGTGAAVAWSHADAGVYTTTCTVSDGVYTEVDNATITVTDPGGGGPTWSLTGLNASNLAPGVGDEVTITAAVTNPDAVALTYTWSGGGTFVGTTEAVTWSNDTEGSFTLTVVVSDGTDDDTLSVDVVVAVIVEPNEAPVFMDESVEPAVAFELHGDVYDPVATQRIWFHGIKAIDADGDALTYEWTADGDGEFTDVSVDGEGFAAAYWAADAAGTFVITLTADDGMGGVASVSAVTGLSTEGFEVVAYPESFTVVGYDGCNMCHSDTVTAWLETNHADAIERSLGIEEGSYGYRNDHCTDCHAIGKFPVGDGGFIDFETTPEYANIQCESCHGTGNPAGMGGGHKPSPFDPGMGYEKDIDGNYVIVDGVYQYDEAYDGSEGYGCGLCHEGSRHGAFESWMGSVHATFEPFEEDGVTPEHKATGASCAKCHNGAEFVRVMVDGGEGVDILEEDYDPSSVSISCATCHDPHSNQFEGQLRIDSTGEVGIPFSAVDNEPAMVSGGRGNTCITCHNGRRDFGDYISRVTNGSGHFGPHGNPQGAVLFGMMGGSIPYTDPPVLTDFDSDHAHKGLENTCVSCHMYSRPYISAEEPHLWGHEMEPVFETCVGCHSTNTDLEDLMSGMHAEFDATMQAFVDEWPAIWKDVTVPEEPELYNRPVVSDPVDPSDHEGPATDDVVGNAYRATLWVWYLHNNDLSGGIHNPTYFRSSMAAAQAELEALNAINFP